MGLLDDAIREHLDLKRRRGADAAEVEQAEREALGPVRRDPFEQAEDEFDPSGSGAPASEREEPGFDQAEEEMLEEHDFAEGDWGDPFVNDRAADEPDADRPAAVLPRDEPLAEPTRVLGPDEFDDQETSAYEDPAVPPPHPAGAGAETVEYDVEEALEAEPDHPAEEDHAPSHAAEPTEPAGEPREGSKEDVLEETPEFLQDTPDHDRLWFEQRPPKDFDFDG